MKIPKQVDVLGQIYKVRIVDEIPDHPDDAGLCCSENKEIFILKGLSPFREQQIFFHELIHAMFDESGLGETTPRLLEEVLCVVGSKVLTRLLHDL